MNPSQEIQSIKRHLIFFRSILASEPPATTLAKLKESGLVRDLDSDVAIQTIVARANRHFAPQSDGD